MTGRFKLDENLARDVATELRLASGLDIGELRPVSKE
jgi:hypothetical protein